MTSHLTPSQMVMTTSHAQVDTVGQLQTGAPNLLAPCINTLNILGLSKYCDYEEQRDSPAIARCLAVIASLTENLIPRTQAGGRLIYVKARHSGRHGFMDCIELLDIASVGKRNLYAIGGPDATYLVVPLLGSECLAGSGRLKSAMAAKQILGMITTCATIKMHMAYPGLAIDMCVKSHKLLARGRRIIRQVYRFLQENGYIFAHTIQDPYTIEDSELNVLIGKCGGDIKLAFCVVASGLPLDAARQRLDLVDDNFHLFMDSLQLSVSDQTHRSSAHSTEYLFLAIDGGGTKCAVSIASHAGILARAHAGAGNFHSVSIDVLLDHIECAVIKAISRLPKRSRPLCSAKMPKFAVVWAGLAGLQHANRRECLTKSLEQLFKVSAEDGTLRLSSDSELMTAHIGLDDSVSRGISLIAGTGSVATAFKQDPNGHVLQIGRAGGWGSLLGDQGSAFDIGKQAVQALLTSLELSQGTETDCLSELEREVLASLGHSKEGLLSRILFPETEMKKTIAGLSRVVTRLGFRTANPDPQALEILTSAARSLVLIVKPLAKKQICDPATSLLILSGGLMKIPEFRSLFLSGLSREGICGFKNMVTVDDPSSEAALFLARQASRTS